MAANTASDSASSASVQATKRRAPEPSDCPSSFQAAISTIGTSTTVSRIISRPSPSTPSA